MVDLGLARRRAGAAVAGRVGTPSIIARVAVGLAWFLPLVAVLLSVVPWQQSAAGDGRVVALTPLEREQTIDAPITGRVVRWAVQEGERVAPGDPVAELGDNDPQLLERLGDEKRAARDEVSDVVARAAKERAGVEKARAEVAKAEAKLTKVEVRLAQQRASLVTAPRHGTVLRLLAKEGTQIVKAGDPLAVLVPDARVRAVELYVRGVDAALIAPGQPARLQFEGWPVFQFSGWPAVAIGTFGGRVALVDSMAEKDGRTRVVVEPDPAEPSWPEERWMRQGTRARGWVLLEQVTLGYELWRTLNGFPPEIPSAPRQDKK